MPSPVGHALAGMAVGLVTAGRPDHGESTHPPAGSGGVRGRLARDPRWRGAAVFAMLGVLPDIDLLFGVHSRYTHSLGAVAIVLAAAWLIIRRCHLADTLTSAGRRVGRTRPTTRPPQRAGLLRAFGRRRRLACAAALAYSSHILLDWLGHDPTPPIGITALWPFSAAYYESWLHLFMPISRRYWLESFWHHNLVAVASELLLLLPCAVLAWWWAAPRRTRRFNARRPHA